MIELLKLLDTIDVVLLGIGFIAFMLLACLLFYNLTKAGYKEFEDYDAWREEQGFDNKRSNNE